MHTTVQPCVAMWPAKTFHCIVVLGATPWLLRPIQSPSELGDRLRVMRYRFATDMFVRLRAVVEKQTTDLFPHRIVGQSAERRELSVRVLASF